MVGKSKGGDSKTLSVLAHVLGIFAGFIPALIIFLASADEKVKIHAKKALNWQLSLLIYFFVSFILVFVLIGFVLIPVLIILDVIFCIVAGVKANRGEIWNYPLSIKFFKD